MLGPLAAHCRPPRRQPPTRAGQKEEQEERASVVCSWCVRRRRGHHQDYEALHGPVTMLPLPATARDAAAGDFPENR